MSKLIKNVGHLMTFNGFLVMNRVCSEVAPSTNDQQVPVVFEVMDGYAAYISTTESNNIIFDLGTIFQLNSFEFNNNLKVWIARLTANGNGKEIVQNYIISERQISEKMTLPIIMGNLLLTISGLSKTKTYFENLYDEDQALIFYYYGLIHRLKGEYDLALENLEISQGLMISEERLKESAFVLHEIGYVYDMKKDFQEAYDAHCKELNIRQEFYPENDVLIGISFYNIGRILVNMDNYDQALSYHQKALYIWEQTLPSNHPLIARSLHSHGVVYLNKRDYAQALHFYTRALELYETIVPRDEHCILMTKTALETIQHRIFQE